MIWCCGSWRKRMVAVVRGEHSAASSRSKTTSLARGSSAPRSKTSASRGKQKSTKSAKPAHAEGSGLGPRLALGVGALVILGGALAGVIMARRDRAPPPPAMTVGAHASPLARWLAPLGFRIEHVEVQGAPDMARADILRAAGLTKD